MKDRKVCIGCEYNKKKSNVRTRQECAFCITTGESRVLKEKEIASEHNMTVSNKICLCHT